MVEAGLEEEARGLLEHQQLNALQTVGYREWFSHFNGQWDQEKAIEEIKKNSRRYAKRQTTWFRRSTGSFAHWRRGTNQKCRIR